MGSKKKQKDIIHRLMTSYEYKGKRSVSNKKRLPIQRSTQFYTRKNRMGRREGRGDPSQIVGEESGKRKEHHDYEFHDKLIQQVGKSRVRLEDSEEHLWSVRNQ